MDKPVYRFSKYNDEWNDFLLEQVGETYTSLSGKTKDDFGHGDAQYITFSNVLANPVTKNSGHGKTPVDDKQNTVLKGDVFFNTSSEVPEEAGLASVCTFDVPNMYVNSFCTAFRPSEEFDPYFLGHMLRSPSSRRRIELLAQGISRFNISKTELLQTTFHRPDLSEQNDIGELFRNVSNLISLQERMVAHLEDVKRTMLAKMFPKKGATVPELRFDGFSGDWTEKKLGDVLTERNVQHEPTDEYPLVSFTVENGVTPKTDRYNREFLVRTSDKKYKATEYNDIVYNPANLKFGAIALNTYGKAVFSPIYVTFTADDGYDPYYMGLYVTTADFINYALKYQEGTVYERMAVKSNDFLTLDVEFPSIEEQLAIGQFFKTFDELIVKQEEKVENGKLLKKALLQKMFV